MDKVKEMVGKKGEEAKGDSMLNKGIDQATDKAGMGDKYDDKIDKVADKQLNNQLGGGNMPGGK